jgi:hypothetical protein
MSDVTERVRTRAYQMWEEAGRPEGRNEEFWFAALRELEGADAAGAAEPPAGMLAGTPAETPAETPPAVASQRGTPAGMPGERIAEQGVPDDRAAALATPRPARRRGRAGGG